MPPGSPPDDTGISLLAFNLMGGRIDGDLLPWVCDYLGIDDLDALMLDLIQLRDFK